MKPKNRPKIYDALIARARFAGVPAFYVPVRGEGNLIEFRQLVLQYEKRNHQGIHHGR